MQTDCDGTVSKDLQFDGFMTLGGSGDLDEDVAISEAHNIFFQIF